MAKWEKLSKWEFSTKQQEQIQREQLFSESVSWTGCKTEFGTLHYSSLSASVFVRGFCSTFFYSIVWIIVSGQYDITINAHLSPTERWSTDASHFLSIQNDNVDNDVYLGEFVTLYSDSHGGQAQGSSAHPKNVEAIKKVFGNIILI